MCGVFGIHGHDEAANIGYLGMHALQHRGQESAGLVAVEDGKLRRHVAMSLVSDAFDRESLAKLPGRTAIGHVRYSTAGSSELRNAQPFVFEYAGGQVSIAHNGNLVNANELRAELEAQGSIFQTSSDTEVIVHLMAKAKNLSSPADVLGRLMYALSRVRGAYSLVLLTSGPVRDRKSDSPAMKIEGSSVAGETPISASRFPDQAMTLDSGPSKGWSECTRTQDGRPFQVRAA